VPLFEPASLFHADAKIQRYLLLTIDSLAKIQIRGIAVTGTRKVHRKATDCLVYAAEMLQYSGIDSMRWVGLSFFAHVISRHGLC